MATHKLVVALSASGVIFIMLGLLTLAVPAAQEGELILQLNDTYALYYMDVAGLFVAAMGVLLTWLSGRLWQYYVKP